MSSATATDNREMRHFELEADRRQRRMFVLIVVAFALLAIGGGIFAAWLILSDDTPIAALPPKTKLPEPVRDFEPEPGVPWGDDDQKTVRAPVTSKLRETLSDKDIGSGLSRIQAALDECARTHGAIDETVVHIDFSVNAGGRVDESDARPPFGKTPLGRCVADVVRTKGSFARSKAGRRDIRWSIKLRRRDG